MIFFCYINNEEANSLFSFIRLQLVQQEGQSQYEIVGTKSHMSSVNKTSDIGMVKCQAYGEVGVRNSTGEVNEHSSNAAVYEPI